MALLISQSYNNRSMTKSFSSVEALDWSNVDLLRTDNGKCIMKPNSENKMSWSYSVQLKTEQQNLKAASSSRKKLKNFLEKKASVKSFEKFQYRLIVDPRPFEIWLLFAMHSFENPYACQKARYLLLCHIHTYKFISKRRFVC